MPSLLTPAFLAGLLALAIPILVHLRMRERRTAQPFPSLMFIRRIPHKSYRQRTLQNLLLLAARTLAVVLLCLAFARPFFPVKAVAASASAGPVARVVALDVSASMQYASVFARAQGEARKAIEEVRATDAVGVLLFSDAAQGLSPPSTDHAKALAAVAAANPGVRSTKFAPALRLAGDWLGALKADRREIVLITDGQTRGLTGVSEVSLPPGTSVSVRTVAAQDPENSAVADVSVEQVRESDRSFAVVSARLIHQGPADRVVNAALEVAGRIIEQRDVAVPANGAVGVTFTKAPLPEGESKARVLLKPDALGMDDVFHFVLGASGGVRVLLVDGSPYVGRTLDIGNQPAFDILRRPSFAASDLAGRSLVILGEGGGSALGSAASQALGEFVRRGGGLILTAPVTAGFLPMTWGESVSRLADRGASIGFVDLDHPALFPFKQARGSDFSRARFLQYRQVKARDREKDGDLRVMARFDDGREALVEAALGAGRVIAFTSPLDGVTSDLPVQPLFLPLMHELARYAAAFKEIPLANRVGAAASLTSPQIGSAIRPIDRVTAPSGRRIQVARDAQGLELDETGFYEVVRNSEATSFLAANVDSAESDLGVLDQGELQAALRPAGASAESAPATAPTDAAARQSWWRVVLIALGLVMLTELVLGNSRGQRTTP